MKICLYFAIRELVSSEIYEAEKDRNGIERLWMLFDERAILTQDALRKRYGPAVVNDWCWGGQLRYRGYRPPDCTVGALYSQHRFGRAFDNSFSDHAAGDVCREILDMTPKQRTELGFGHIRRIETGVSWFHYDLGNTGLPKGEIFTFGPSGRGI